MKTEHTYCTECHGRLFAIESQQTGLCTECREGADHLDDLDSLDLEDRLDAALADSVTAIPTQQPEENLL